MGQLPTTAAALALLPAVSLSQLRLRLRVAGGKSHVAAILQFVVFKSLAIPLSILMLFPV